MLFWLASFSTGRPVCAYEIETVAGRAMGTSYTVKFDSRGLALPKEDFVTSVSEELERIESIFSLYRSDSEISRLNAAPPGIWIPVSKDLYEVAQYAVVLYNQTEGAFDPTLQPLVELWQSDRLSGAWKPPTQEEIKGQLQCVGVSQFAFQSAPPSIQKLTKQVKLDLNALVEGWAIERVLDLLKQKGCTDGLFEIGGEYGARGRKSESVEWKIGIEDPHSPSQVYAKLTLNDTALCTSGSYRQAREYVGKQYSHIIDPRTGSPIEHDLRSVSVLHANAMIADGWATALMVLGPEKAEELAERHGLAASFVKRSSNASCPTLTKAAVGKILLVAVQPQWRFRQFSLAVLCALICFSFVIAVIVRRKQS